MHDVHVVSIGVLVCCEREAGHILTFATDAAAAGISKASTALNVVLMIIGAWGVLACTRADYLWVSAHSAMVLGLIFVFLVYIFLAIAFGKYAVHPRGVCVGALVLSNALILWPLTGTPRRAPFCRQSPCPRGCGQEVT